MGKYLLLKSLLSQSPLTVNRSRFLPNVVEWSIVYVVSHRLTPDLSVKKGGGARGRDSRQLVLARGKIHYNSRADQFFALNFVGFWHFLEIPSWTRDFLGCEWDCCGWTQPLPTPFPCFWRKEVVAAGPLPSAPPPISRQAVQHMVDQL